MFIENLKNNIARDLERLSKNLKDTNFKENSIRLSTDQSVLS